MTSNLPRTSEEGLISALHQIERRAAELAKAVAEFGLHSDVAETAEAYGRATGHVERVLTGVAPPMHILRTTLYISDVQRLLADPRRVV